MLGPFKCNGYHQPRTNPTDTNQKASATRVADRATRNSPGTANRATSAATADAATAQAASPYRLPRAAPRQVPQNDQTAVGVSARQTPTAHTQPTKHPILGAIAAENNFFLFQA